MKPASLFLVFVLAKAAGVVGHQVPLSAWSAIAYVWQDALVAVAFAAIDVWLWRHERVSWALYAVLALYAAVNIPVVRVLSTPLTVSMLRAARGTLSDSIVLYATWSNVLLIAMAIAAACLTPLWLRRVSRLQTAIPLIVCITVGPFAAARVDTRGLDRNAWTALAGSMMPHVAARAAGADWRGRGFDRARETNLLR